MKQKYIKTLLTSGLIISTLTSTLSYAGPNDRNGRQGRNNRQKPQVNPGTLLPVLNFKMIGDRLLQGYIGPRSVTFEMDPKYTQKISRYNGVRTLYVQAFNNYEANNIALKKIDKKVLKLTSDKKALKQSNQSLKAQIETVKTQNKTIKADLPNIKQTVSLNTLALSQSQASLDACKADATCDDTKKAQLRNLVKSQKQALSNSKTKLQTKKTKLQKNKELIATNEGTLATNKTAVASLNSQIQNETAKRATLVQNVNMATQNLQLMTANYKAAEKLVKKYLRRMSEQIISYNRAGYEEGIKQGQIDGFELAKDEGTRQGEYYGSEKGKAEGTRVGQNNSFEAGRTTGLSEGQSQGIEDGTTLGKKEGTNEGNRLAGNSEGYDQGITDANNSDASSVGTKDGKKAGLQRANREGKNVGEREARSEIINSNENSDLPSKNINGAFAGTFGARGIPGYGGFNCDRGGMGDRFGCRNYRPQRNGRIRAAKERIFRTAFLDSYNHNYRIARQSAYLNNINSFYNQAFSEAETRNFNHYSVQEYPTYRTEGRNRGYGENYPKFKAQYRQQFKTEYTTMFKNSPNRASQIYVSNFKDSKDTAYSNRYSVIKNDFYGKFEQSTFDDNYANLKAEYKAAEALRAQGIYDNNPVLSYVDVSTTDLGVNGVAGNDGIFQPGENASINLVINNYGKKEAANVKVVLSNGQSYKLPSIPARSKATIMGAAKSNINARLGGTFNENAIIFSSVKDPKIDGHNYANSSNGQLNNSARVSKTVKYPMSLSLGKNSEFIVGKSTGLNLSISNISNRPYEGNLKIDLKLPNIENDHQSFNSIDGLDGSTKLSDANITFKNPSESYRAFTVYAEISKNGVKLGEVALANQFSKSAFIQNSVKKHIAVVNVNNLAAVERLFNAAGGIDKVNVLDLSIAGQTIKNAQNKTLIVMGQNALNQLSSKTSANNFNNNTLLLVGEQALSVMESQLLNSSFASGASNARTPIPGFGNALILGKEDLSKTLKGMNYLLASSLSNLTASVKLADIFSLNAGDHLALIKRSVNDTTALTLNTPMKTLSIKSHLQVKNIERMGVTRKLKSADLILNVVSNAIQNDKSLPMIASAYYANYTAKKMKGGGLFSKGTKAGKAIKKQAKALEKLIKKKSFKNYGKLEGARNSVKYANVVK